MFAGSFSSALNNLKSQSCGVCPKTFWVNILVRHNVPVVVGVLGSMSQKLKGYLMKLGIPDSKKKTFANVCSPWIGAYPTKGVGSLKSCIVIWLELWLPGIIVTCVELSCRNNNNNHHQSSLLLLLLNISKRSLQS